MDPSSLGIDCCARAVEQCLSTRSTGRRDELRLRVGHGVCRDDKCLPSDLPDLSHRRRILTAACCLADPALALLAGKPATRSEVKDSRIGRGGFDLPQCRQK